MSQRLVARFDPSAFDIVAISTAPGVVFNHRIRRTRRTMQPSSQRTQACRNGVKEGRRDRDHLFVGDRRRRAGQHHGFDCARSARHSISGHGPAPAGLTIVCLALFSLEHFVGLGKLHWLGLPVTVLSLGVIWYDRARFLDETFKASEIVFLCAVLFGLVWRLAYPEIVEDNDRLTDFHLVANYLSGERLPPFDDWLPDQKLDDDCTFQHYSAALLGRIFGWGPGTSFNMAAVILAALVLSLAWEFLVFSPSARSSSF